MREEVLLGAGAELGVQVAEVVVVGFEDGLVRRVRRAEPPAVREEKIASNTASSGTVMRILDSG